MCASKHLNLSLFSRHIFLFILLTAGIASFAGDSTDALKDSIKSLTGTDKARVLLKLAKESLYTDAELSKACTNEAYLIALRHNNRLIMAQSLIQQGLWLNATGSYDSAIKTLDKALTMVQWPAHSVDLARLYTVKGISNENSGYSDSAMYCYQKAFTIYKNTGHHQGLANTYLNLGCLFLRLKNYDEATVSLQKALNESLKYKATNTLGSIYNNLGILYDVRGDNSKALEYYRKALEIEERSGNKDVMATIYHNVALIHSKQGYPRKALEELNKSVELKLFTGNREGTANSYVEIAGVYQDLDNIEMAAAYCYKALAIAEAGKFTFVEANCRKQLAVIYDRKGEYKKASAEWKKALVLNDSLYNQSVSRKVSELQSRYEILRKEQENKILKQQISLQQAKTSQQRTYFRFLVFAAIASIVVLILVFILLRLKVTGMKKHLKAEQEIKALELKNLNSSIQLKNKELTALSANFINVNDILSHIRRSLLRLKKDFIYEVPPELNELLSLVNSNLDNDLNWKKFRMSFEETHAGFLDMLAGTIPDLTLNEQKLCAYLYIGLSSNEIARIMNISLAAVNKNRQRIRKTLGLPPNTDITEYLKTLDMQRHTIA